MAQQRLVTPRHQHDHGRVGAGEVMGGAAGADHHVAGAMRLARGPANAAEPVPAAPVHQPARMRQDGHMVRRQPGANGAQLVEITRAGRQQRQRVLHRAEVDGEGRSPVRIAQKRPAMLAGGQTEREDSGRTAIFGRREQVAPAPDRHETRGGIAQRLVHPVLVGPEVGDAVQRAAGIGIGATGRDDIHWAMTVARAKPVSNSTHTTLETLPHPPSLMV